MQHSFVSLAILKDRQSGFDRMPHLVCTIDVRYLHRFNRYVFAHRITEVADVHQLLFNLRVAHVFDQLLGRFGM